MTNDKSKKYEIGQPVRIYSAQAAAICLLFVSLLNGCMLVPKGSKSGAEYTVGERKNSEGQITERIFAVPTEHHYVALWGPDGGSEDYIDSRTWRFYLQVENGNWKSLPFLKTKSEFVFSPWVLIEPLSRSNLWIAVMFEGVVLSGEKCDFRFICFSSSKKLDEKVIACVGDDIDVETSPYSRLTSYYLPNLKEPIFKFDPEKNLLFYKYRGAEMQYDPFKKQQMSIYRPKHAKSSNR